MVFKPDDMTLPIQIMPPYNQNQDTIDVEPSCNVVSGLVIVKSRGMEQYICLAYRGSSVLHCHDMDGTVTSQIALPGVLGMNGILLYSLPEDGEGVSTLVILDQKDFHVGKLYEDGRGLSLSEEGLRTLSLGYTPGGISRNEQNNTIIITDTDNKKILVYQQEVIVAGHWDAPPACEVTAIPGDPLFPSHVAPFRGGYAVLDFSSGGVSVINREGEESLLYPSASHIAGEPGGGLLVADKINNICFKYSAFQEGGVLERERLWDGDQGGIAHPSFIVLDCASRPVLYIVGVDAKNQWKCKIWSSRYPVDKRFEQRYVSLYTNIFNVNIHYESGILCLIIDTCSCRFPEGKIN